MCGFAGEYVFGEGLASAGTAERMAASLAHRGPDEEGVWASPDGRCALALRRLAVIDPPGSHQPMTWPDGSATIAFNGEVYNFRELRRQLESAGLTFRTQGDTEVLLGAWRHWGREMLDRLEGMFAFAIFDASAGGLFLARDRLGQKPLWYSMLADRIVFASEAKALRAHPSVAGEVDAGAVGLYLTFGYVPAPRSIWRGVVKLPPAHWLSPADASARPQRYWKPPEATTEIDSREAGQRVREALSKSTERRLVADVGIGVLLSGGIDSSVVAALMCNSAGVRVRSFTAGFADSDFDERPFARQVAGHLGTEHRELLVEPVDLVELLDKLVAQYDEPFADSSALPTHLICRAAREHVTVALTGDGGDEAFGGYDRHRAMRLAETMGPCRWALTKLAAGAAALVAPHDERNRLRRLVRFAADLDEPPSRRYLAYRRLFSPEQLAALLERDFAAEAATEAPGEWFCDLYEQGDFDDELAYAQQCDLLTYLPDDLLVKADIASMACSLELRSPMLDREVVSLGLSLPADLKLRGRRGKAILREAFGELLPPEVFTRAKRGFGAPIDRWLRGELSGALRETLLEGPLVERGWISRMPAQRMIEDHIAGRADHRHRLWALLWLGRWLANESGA